MNIDDLDREGRQRLLKLEKQRIYEQVILPAQKERERRRDERRRRLAKSYVVHIFSGLSNNINLFDGDEYFARARERAIEQAKLLADEVLKGEENDN